MNQAPATVTERCCLRCRAAMAVNSTGLPYCERCRGHFAMPYVVKPGSLLDEMTAELRALLVPVLLDMVRSSAEGRCPVCNWPMARSVDEGCVAGNCSFRPERESAEYGRWRQRTEIILFAYAVSDPAPLRPAPPKSSECVEEFAHSRGNSNVNDVRDAATGER